MSQVQEVVRCYSCETFQVQIQKKIKKWTCKVCNEKQSLKKVYFTGLGAECRNVVKEFNMKRGELSEMKSAVLMQAAELGENENQYEDTYPGNSFEDGGQVESQHRSELSQPRVSKWNAFMTAEEIQETEKAFNNHNKKLSNEETTDDLQSDEIVEDDFDCDSYLSMNSASGHERMGSNTTPSSWGSKSTSSWGPKSQQPWKSQSTSKTFESTAMGQGSTSWRTQSPSKKLESTRNDQESTTFQHSDSLAHTSAHNRVGQDISNVQSKWHGHRNDSAKNQDEKGVKRKINPAAPSLGLSKQSKWSTFLTPKETSTDENTPHSTVNQQSSSGFMKNTNKNEFVKPKNPSPPVVMTDFAKKFLMRPPK